MNFKFRSKFKPTGDQPQAIKKLVSGLESGKKHQTLLGITGSGKTLTMAKIIEHINKQTLVISHNKTLAFQLYQEFKDFFPDNAVHYFVSYYDYYQPEAYIPQTDTFIEKDAKINEEIDRLRHHATQSILTRRDTLVIASVSCIYGLGDPVEYEKQALVVNKNDTISMREIITRLVDLQFERDEIDLKRGTFRRRGNILEINPAISEGVIRIEWNNDKVRKITEMNMKGIGEISKKTVCLEKTVIFPAKHFITEQNRLDEAIKNIRLELKQRLDFFSKHKKLLEAQRIQERTNYDLEMLKTTGYVNGIENYSRHLAFRKPGEAPYTLLDFFPKDFLCFMDESHMSVPQIRGMYNGDKARKETLINFGFRLPSAKDNRPLKFDEFLKKMNQIIYVSATPGPYETSISKSRVIEQLIRPTGLLDPTVEVKPTKNQLSDLVKEIKKRTAEKQRTLVTTLTKRMAEDLTDYLKEKKIKVSYLHSEIETAQRPEILKDLRTGKYDVIVGINLLREGLDLPEVSLVAILDADKEGFLRGENALIQTMGRAARHIKGHVIMYADTLTSSMKKAISETKRRRRIQEKYNKNHGITPKSINKEIRELLFEQKKKQPKTMPFHFKTMSINDLEKEMYAAAKKWEFEKAAYIRDKIQSLRQSG